MTSRPGLFGIALLALAAAAGIAFGAGQPAQAKPQPKVEVVFVLDTTGSMGGLINAAKQKIWAISNQIASGNPTPDIKVGLVAFRDRGDTYITKVFDLTDDLDAVYGNLMTFQAAGGGDTPESVNQALHEAVTKITWSRDKNALKLIFLVGDAPPHMDYPDDVKYPETCKLALAKDIIINTVQCGNDAETKKYWLDICRLAEGRYVQIDAKGGSLVAIETPFDKDLAKLNVDLTNNTLVFGTKEQQKAATMAKGAAGGVGGGGGKKGGKGGGAAAAADRAGFVGNTGKIGSYDLLQNIKDGKVKLEDLKKDELPEQMQTMSVAEQKTFLEKIDKERQELISKARELDKQRSAYIAQKQKEAAKDRAPDSFDGQVIQLLQQQAARIHVDYGKEKKK